MRKTALILLALSLLITPALAEGDLSLSGQLEPAHTDVITAPFSGTVVSVPVSAGDFATATDVLFELTTTKVYAPCDGTVAGLRAQEGDSLSDLALIYEAPVYIEPDSAYVISASTSGAYDDNDNRYIHVGEHVYLTSTNNSSRTGEGIIISVTGTDYTVEVQSGTIRLAETCRISRDPDSDETEGRIGSGKTERNNPVPVAAEGSVLRVCVSEGDAVRKGDLILETVPGDLRGKALTGSQVTAGTDVVVQSVNASVGDAVQQGQALATVFPVGTLVARVQVDESDLVDLEIGDDVTVELEGTSGAVTYKGVIEKISHTSNPDVNGAVYEVTVSFENDDFVRQGMSVTVRKAL